jgi:hypothetical protein
MDSKMDPKVIEYNEKMPRKHTSKHPFLVLFWGPF